MELVDFVGAVCKPGRGLVLADKVLRDLGRAVRRAILFLFCVHSIVPLANRVALCQDKNHLESAVLWGDVGRSLCMANRGLCVWFCADVR